MSNSNGKVVCSKCKAENAGTSKFCIYCGTKLSADQAPQQEAAPASAPVDAPAPQPEPAPPAPKPAPQPKPVAAPPEPKPAPQPEPVTAPPVPEPVDDHEYTTILSDNTADDEDDDATTLLLPPEPEKMGKLVAVPTGEEVEIDKYPFVIGRKKNFADFYIEDNTAISRKHAEITYEDDRWFIRDLDSKNKSYINDEEIVALEAKELNDGDRIKVADLEFDFVIFEREV
jgi:pSer/pThr/pTyr-binding forkhead associated (FHA) protein